MKRLFIVALLLPLVLSGSGRADDRQNQQKKSGSEAPKLREESRVWILRGLQSEYATLRKALPRGEKGLPLGPDGKIDDKELLQRMTDNGAAARPGELVQITGIVFKKNAIVFEVNGGGRKRRKWYQGIEVGMGRTTRPVAADQSMQMPTGSSIELLFGRSVPDLTVDDLKRMLGPVLDFTRRSASVLYSETLPKEIQEAIKNHQVTVEMDKDMVLASRGRPERKIRERKGRKETEDWIYGTPPSKVTIVTFDGDKVIEVKELTPGIADPGVRAEQASTPAAQLPQASPAPAQPAPAAPPPAPPPPKP